MICKQPLCKLSFPNQILLKQKCTRRHFGWKKTGIINHQHVILWKKHPYGKLVDELLLINFWNKSEKSKSSGISSLTLGFPAGWAWNCSRIARNILLLYWSGLLCCCIWIWSSQQIINVADKWLNFYESPSNCVPCLTCQDKQESEFASECNWVWISVTRHEVKETMLPSV